MELTQAAQEQRWVGLGELEGRGSELRDQEPGRAAIEGPHVASPLTGPLGTDAELIQDAAGAPGGGLLSGRSKAAVEKPLGSVPSHSRDALGSCEEGAQGPEQGRLHCSYGP